MYDTIVIGSGIGSLTTATILAKAAGQRVLVLEKHSEPGGLTHVFRRDGASWDVGLHYIGDMAPGSPARSRFDYLTGDAVKWNQMPHNLEHHFLPDMDLKTSSDPKETIERIVRAFPEEARGIRAWFRDITTASSWAKLYFASLMAPPFIGTPLRAIARMTGRKWTASTAKRLNAHIISPTLRALLTNFWGDYGLPPSQSAFVIHALITEHYQHGAWFPVGGSGRIARAMETQIESTGGAVRVCQEVTEIIVENGRAVGVQVVDRRSSTPMTCNYRANRVISGVGAAITFNQLLPTHGQVGAKTQNLRDKLRTFPVGTSAVTAYLTLNDSPCSIGIEGENLWISTMIDHDEVARRSADLLKGHVYQAFVSFPSIKSGEEKNHTGEIICFAPYDAFAKWEDTPQGNRGKAYSALKERMGKAMLALAETGAPGITELTTEIEVSTPLSIKHFTSHPYGAFYGIPATPKRFKSHSFGPRTPIPGLLLTGQDAGSLGIMGALMGGVGAAARALGTRGFLQIQRAFRTPVSTTPTPGSGPLPEGKHHGVLISRERLTPTIIELVFGIEGAIRPWLPGQYARLHVGHFEWRDYSIAGLENNQLRLLVNTKTGGYGSQFAATAPIGSQTVVELPLGANTPTQSEQPQLFIATGTGLAPMLPHFLQLEQAGRLVDATLVFGCRTPVDDLTKIVTDPLPGTIVRCYSQIGTNEEVQPGTMRGRVTDAFDHPDLNVVDHEIYVYGSSAMVHDCVQLLEIAGAERIVAEHF